jgi:hypothetical protein
MSRVMYLCNEKLNVCYELMIYSANADIVCLEDGHFFFFFYEYKMDFLL